MVRKCRWAERNSGLFKQILADICLYTVGDGIKPQSHASTPEMQERYEAYFAEKAKRIDITNRFSFSDSFLNKTPLLVLSYCIFTSLLSTSPHYLVHNLERLCLALFYPLLAVEPLLEGIQHLSLQSATTPF